MTVSDLLEQPCNKSDYINKVVTNSLQCCILVDNLGQAVRTQLVDGLLADLLQAVRILRCIAKGGIAKDDIFKREVRHFFQPCPLVHINAR